MGPALKVMCSYNQRIESIMSPTDTLVAPQVRVSAQPTVDAVLAWCAARYADQSDPAVAFLDSLVFPGE